MALSRSVVSQYFLSKEMNRGELNNRVDALLHLANGMSKSAKSQVITALCNYASNNLVSMIDKLMVNANRYDVYNNIVAGLSFKDLIFLHHAERQLMAISDIRSNLRDTVLPIVMQYKSALKRKHNMETAWMMLGFVVVLSTMTRDESYLLLLAFVGVVNLVVKDQLKMDLFDLITEARIDDVYEEIKSAPLLENSVNTIGDGLDHVVTQFANYGRRQITLGLNSAVQFVNRNLPAAPEPENRIAPGGPQLN